MFKSIKNRITAVFMVFMALITLIAGGVRTVMMVCDYCDKFRISVNEFFSEDFIRIIDETGSAVSVAPETDGNGLIMTQQNTNRLSGIIAVTEQRVAESGIDPQSDIYILDGTSYSKIRTIRGDEQRVVSVTQSIQNAAGHARNFNFSYTGDYMDYAHPVAGSTDSDYIIYIYNSKDELRENIRDFLYEYLKLIAGVILLSFIAGRLAARAASKPIRRLNEKAKTLMTKNPAPLDDMYTKDEVGELARTFSALTKNLSAAAETVKLEKTKLETMLQNIHDGILAFDSKGRLVHINSAANRLLHRKYLDDIEFDRFFKEINANITLGDLLYLKQDDTIERSVVIDGENYLQLTFTTFDNGLKSTGVLALIHDVTKHEKLEQSRRSFVADVSHELRTPLTTIKSYSETLIDSPDADRDLTTRFLYVIASEAERMSRIVGDLLTLSKLDAKQTQFLPPEELDVRQMLKALTERMRLNAKKKGLKLQYTPINDVPPIMGDKDSFEKIILNILSNAIKYTPEGGSIDIYSSRIFDEVCIKIKDTGIGIDKEHLPHIFDRFYRVDKARSRDKGGTGLGLAIAKQTLETVFKGKIEIESKVGEGTEVIITIPVPKSGKK